MLGSWNSLTTTCDSKAHYSDRLLEDKAALSSPEPHPTRVKPTTASQTERKTERNMSVPPQCVESRSEMTAQSCTVAVLKCAFLLRFASRPRGWNWRRPVGHPLEAAGSSLPQQDKKNTILFVQNIESESASARRRFFPLTTTLASTFG